MPLTEERKAYNRQWYAKNREDRIRQIKLREARMSRYMRSVVDRYKVLVGCSRCGFNYHARALDLHHVDPSTKHSTVSHLINSAVSWSRVKAEIRKCVVLCANCHRIEHYELMTE